MKLTGRDAASYFAKPDATAAGCLIHGGDAMRVALRRQQVIAALIGPEGEAEMRLARIHASELKKEPSRAADEMKARGFFPGPRVVFVEDAGDAAAPPIAAALEDWRPGDAQLVVTAGSLNARSALRKAFEAHPKAFAVGIYDDPPSRDEIEAELRRAGLPEIPREAMEGLVALSRALDPGDFRQTLEKLALYKLGDPAPVSPADIAAIAPATFEAALDDALNAVAEARADHIGPLIRRLEGQGVLPVTLCIGAVRHFRALYAAAADPGGAGAGIARLRPPVFGPRRDRILRQAQAWGTANLERALQILADTDLKLRSAGQKAPAMAVVERTLIRLAMLGARR